MGILEDMLLSLDELHVKVDAMSSGTVMATLESAPPGAVTPLTNTGVTLDTEGKPWDERIHSVTRNQTVKGVWKIRKGADKTLIAKVKAETLAVIPSVPGVVTPTPAPTPTTAAPENVYKKSAIAAINTLTNDLSVDFDNIQNALINLFDVDSFDKLPEASFETAADEFCGWRDNLLDINEIVKVITELGAENGINGIATICESRGFKTVSQATVDAIPELIEALREFKQQWIEFTNQ